MNKTKTIIEVVLRLAIVSTFQFISLEGEVQTEFLYKTQFYGLKKLPIINLSFINLLEFTVCLLMFGACVTLLIFLFVKTTRLWIKITPVIILLAVLMFMARLAYPYLVKDIVFYLFVTIALVYIAFVSLINRPNSTTIA